MILKIRRLKILDSRSADTIADVRKKGIFHNMIYLAVSAGIVLAIILAVFSFISTE